jgi:hypothetical protein
VSADGEARARVRGGGLRGAELVDWLAAHRPADRDAAIEGLLGIRAPRAPAARPHAEMLGYVPSGIAPIVRAVLEVPITPDDVLVDLGAGLGKVAMAIHLLSGARTRGIELLPELVAQATAIAGRAGLEEVTFVQGDAREADISDATVFFLYLPFTGEVLASVMQRLLAIAEHREIVICSLGLDLRAWEFIAERPTREFWLSIYDSRVPGAAPRGPRAPLELGPAGERVAREG